MSWNNSLKGDAHCLQVHQTQVSACCAWLGHTPQFLGPRTSLLAGLVPQGRSPAAQALLAWLHAGIIQSTAALRMETATTQRVQHFLVCTLATHMTTQGLARLQVHAAGDTIEPPVQLATLASMRVAGRAQQEGAIWGRVRTRSSRAHRARMPGSAAFRVRLGATHRRQGRPA